MWNNSDIQQLMGTGNGPPVPVIQCRDVHKLNASQQCAFVNTTSDCHMTGGFIDYTQFVYCVFPIKLIPLALLSLFLWLAFLFIALAVAADNFFCPSLTVIAKTLRLSDNIAGVTLLAFGNGAPDVFSAIAAIRGAKDGDAGLAFGALLGGGVFITTVIAGSVCIAQPFKMMQRPFLRDAIFYLASIYMTFYILCDGVISLQESICYIMMYVGYVIFVLVARFIRKRQQARSFRHLSSSGIIDDSLVSDTDDTMDRPLYTDHPHLHGVNWIARQLVTNSIYHDDAEVEHLLSDDEEEAEVDDAAPSPFRDFARALSPVNMTEWSVGGAFTKVLAVIKSFALFTLRLTIPVVDHDEPKNNWNRHLNSLHCITAPLAAFCLAKPGVFLHYIHGLFPVWGLILIVGTALATLVFLTSVDHHPPRYHWVLAYIAFGTAIVWIQCIATEVVNLLQTFGVVFDINSAVLGLTVLAMGNSIGDLVSDITMARQGQPRTAISACYGGPMFNLLLGIGIPFTISCASTKQKVKISLTVIQLVLLASLFTILIFSLVTIPFVLKFRMSRKFGICLYALYAAFIVAIVLVKTGVLGGYGYLLHWCNV